MNKNFLIIILVIAVGLFGVLKLTQNNDNTQNAGDSSQQASTSEHVAGQGTAGVTLVEYADFQCPACKSYAPIVDQLKQEYSDEIKVQFIHYPLVSIHPNAFIASRAAEAAGLQGKFFQMHNALFDQQEAWSQATDPTDTFVSFANTIGIEDIDKFRSDMQSELVGDTINADVEKGRSEGISSTPTFILNGTKIENTPRSYEEFKQLIDDEIAKQQDQS